MSELSPLQKAALAIEELRRRLARAEAAAQAGGEHEPIAIVGMACRFPGNSASPAAYWDFLLSGEDAVGDTPASRWGADEAAGLTTNQGGYLADVARFDARFFGIPPREAAAMDPQHRLLLETAWHALEDAGQPPDRLAGTPVGVYLGLSASDYSQMLAASGDTSAYYLTGNPLNAAAGRISFTLGLHGPSMVFDTACSSTAVAVHQACQGLRGGDCDLALAGGASLILSPQGARLLTAGGMLATDGRCKTFDARADGYVRGEGVGVVVLKRARDLSSGERARAVILGSAVVHDGASSGFTVPNGQAQQQAIRKALERAGVSPAEVDFVECHGTGTPLGDPIEVRSLGAVFGPGRDPARPLALGAVKSRIGHLEPASAVASLVKTVLTLEQGYLPANLHCQTPNPDIPWNALPLDVLPQGRAWSAPGARRVAGINAFGASGTNVHLVVASPARAPEGGDTLPTLPLPLPISARSPEALGQLLAAYQDRLRAGVPFAHLAARAGRARSHLPWRLALLPTDATSPDAAPPLPGAPVHRAPRLRLSFPAALNTAPGDQLDAGVWQAALAAYPPTPSPTPEIQGVVESLAWATLWEKWGIVPAACTGQGAGRVAAAVFAGAVSWPAALAWLQTPSPRPSLALSGRTRYPLLTPHPERLEEAHLALTGDIAGENTEEDLWPVLPTPPGTVTEALARAYTLGVDLNWAALAPPGPWVDLPAYPFAGERHWFSPVPTNTPTTDVVVGAATPLPIPTPSPAPAPVAVSAPRGVDARVEAIFQAQLAEAAGALQQVVSQQLAWIARQGPGPAADPPVPEPAPAPLPAFLLAGEPGTHQLLLLAGADEADLLARCGALATALGELPAEAWADAWTRLAAESRAQAATQVAQWQAASGTPWGAALVAEDPAAAGAVLAAVARGEKSRLTRACLRGAIPPDAPRLSFLYSGLGDQYPGMGAALYRRLPGFRAAFDHFCGVHQQTGGEDLRPRVFGPGSLEGARHIHPALLALQLALTQLWRSWGVVPDAVFGYSLGDYAAATTAGVFSPGAVLPLVSGRAALIEAAPEGTMVAAGVGAAALAPHLPEGAWVAAESTPHAAMAAGTRAAMAELLSRLAAARIAARPLQASHPFHTPLLQSIAPGLEALLARAQPAPARLPMVFGSSGQWVSPSTLCEPAAWITHSVGPVRCEVGLGQLLTEAPGFYLEVGPGLALTSFLFQHPAAASLSGRPAAGSLPNADDPRHAAAFLLETLGRLWLAGYRPDWAAVARDLGPAGSIPQSPIHAS